MIGIPGLLRQKAFLAGGFTLQKDGEAGGERHNPCERYSGSKKRRNVTKISGYFILPVSHYCKITALYLPGRMSTPGPDTERALPGYYQAG